MRSLRTFAAWLLLAVLSTTVAPKELWHACAHKASAHPAAPGSASVQAPCAVCDQGALVGVAAPSNYLKVVQLATHGALCAVVEGTSFGFTPLAADRGPPTVA